MSHSSPGEAITHRSKYAHTHIHTHTYRKKSRQSVLMKPHDDGVEGNYKLEENVCVHVGRKEGRKERKKERKASSSASHLLW